MALVALGATVPALAADLGSPRPYTKAPAYAAPIYNWTGFYIGGHVGGAFAGDNSLHRQTAAASSAACRAAPIISSPRAGWSVSKAQYSWLGSNNSGVLFPGGVLVTSNSNQLGSVTGRLGYTWGPALLYAKGGYAWTDGNNFNVTVGGVPAAFTTDGNHRDGYTVGGGLEYMFAPNWSAKVEYQYYNFGNTTFTSRPGRPRRQPIPRRRAHRKGRPELSLQLGWPGGCEVLIGDRIANLRKRPASRRPFCFRLPKTSEPRKLSRFY